MLILAAVVNLSLPSCDSGQSPVRVYDLECEGQENPLGIDRLQPSLQWKIQDTRRGAAQTAWQIMVATSPGLLSGDQADLWDSGKVTSSQSVHIRYQGTPPASGQQLFWKVRVWDQEGQPSAWSETASWETGLLDQGDWKGTWIARGGDAPARSACMRQEFSLGDQEITKARLFVTGLGSYLFYINGARVGNDLLTPGWTDFTKRVEYQVYDVEEFLEAGVNVMGAELGSMWWSGGLGWQGGTRYSEGPLKLLAQLEVTLADGSVTRFVTDSTWKWHDSPVVYDHIYHGETYDFNLEMPGWNQSGFDDTGWQAVLPAVYEGLVVGPRFPALREQMEVNPIGLTEPLPGEYVFDLGQNIVGWARLMAQVPKGDTITLRFAELLHDDGTVAQENLRTAKATDRIISDGNPFVWEPRFTYHGFRYVQVSGLSGKPELTALIGKVIHTSEPFVGSFETSDKLVNAIYKNITWGQRGNFFTVPTDCPQRDERLGWMGDAQIFAPTANFNMQLNRFWSKWMTDIADGQDSAGWVHDVSPAVVVGGPSKPGWGDACVIIPWMTWRYYGDSRILEEFYPVMKKWVDYMHGQSEELIYIWGEKGGWNGYGDWIAVEPTPSEPIGTAYFAYSASLLARMAGILGNSADSLHYADLSARVAAAYHAKYWDRDSLRYPGGTQTSSLLPLAFGITPPELRTQVITNLVENVKARDYHPTTGFLGTGYILPVLSASGHHDLAWRMITQTSYPSWGYMVEKGATSIWELWNSDTERPEGMNSRNHFALGCVGEWMWNTLAGINLCDQEPGFKKVLIQPQPAGDLDWVKATYETNYGRLAISWKREGQGLRISLTVPPNTSAVITPPSMKAGAVLTEKGKRADQGSIPGITPGDNGSFVALAGTYDLLFE